MNSRQPATFQAYYNEPYNAIVKPHRFLWYFRHRWMRELGPLGTSIVLYLRGLCYHNPDKGELRDICECRMEEIADAIGASRATVARALSEGSEGVAALRRFVARQQQYNLTERGVRRATTLYHVSMDDPIHPDDQAQYELLCRQHEERQREREHPLKPVYRRPEPKSQNETMAENGGPKSQIETMATGPKSQIETLYSIPYFFLTNGRTFNVREDPTDVEEPAPPKQTETPQTQPSDVPNETWIEARARELVSHLQDEGSQRRHEQLVAICDRHNCLHLIDKAVDATRTRQRKAGKQGSLERPGAYYQSVLVRLLEDRNIHVPTLAERTAEPQVADLVRMSLVNSTEIRPTAETEMPVDAPRSPKMAPVGSQMAHDARDAEMRRLRAENADAWHAFQEYVAQERERYRAELASLRDGPRARLMEAFEGPQKQRALFARWTATLERRP